MGVRQLAEEDVSVGGPVCRALDCVTVAGVANSNKGLAQREEYSKTLSSNLLRVFASRTVQNKSSCI